MERMARSVIGRRSHASGGKTSSSAICAGVSADMSGFDDQGVFYGESFFSDERSEEGSITRGAAQRRFKEFIKTFLNHENVYCYRSVCTARGLPCLHADTERHLARSESNALFSLSSPSSPTSSQRAAETELQPEAVQAVRLAG